MSPHSYRVLARLSTGYSRLRGRLPMCYSPVCHYRSNLAKKPTVRLACLKHAASVHPELGSNSQNNDDIVHHGHIWVPFFKKGKKKIIDDSITF